MAIDPSYYDCGSTYTIQLVLSNASSHAERIENFAVTDFSSTISDLTLTSIAYPTILQTGEMLSMNLEFTLEQYPTTKSFLIETEMSTNVVVQSFVFSGLITPPTPDHLTFSTYPPVSVATSDILSYVVEARDIDNSLLSDIAIGQVLVTKADTTSGYSAIESNVHSYAGGSVAGSFTASDISSGSTYELVAQHYVSCVDRSVIGDTFSLIGAPALPESNFAFWAKAEAAYLGSSHLSSGSEIVDTWSVVYGSNLQFSTIGNSTAVFEHSVLFTAGGARDCVHQFTDNSLAQASNYSDLDLGDKDIFLVTKLGTGDAINSPELLTKYQNSGSRRAWGIYGNYNNTHKYGFHTRVGPNPTNSVVTTQTYDSNAVNILNCRVDNSVIYITFGGTTDSTAITSYSDGTGLLAFGQNIENSYFEIIITKSLLTAPERSTVLSYLESKYSESGA